MKPSGLGEVHGPNPLERTAEIRTASLLTRRKDLSETPSTPVPEYVETRLIGTGHSLPERVVPNSEFEELLDTTDEWIRTRTGIHQRHFAAETDRTSQFAAEAGRNALESAGIPAEELDAIIVSTNTPDMRMPATANFVQHEIGAVNAYAYDIAAACSGFVFADSVQHRNKMTLDGAFHLNDLRHIGEEPGIDAAGFVDVFDASSHAKCVAEIENPLSTRSLDQTIQRGASMLIPPEVMGAHIGPRTSHTTGRTQSLSFRAATALFGHLGVEWDVTKLRDEDRIALRAVIAMHKEHRALLHGGNAVHFTTDPAFNAHGVYSKDRSQAIVSFAQLTTAPSQTPPPLRMPGLRAPRSPNSRPIRNYSRTNASASVSTRPAPSAACPTRSPGARC